ncbi:hypothetical protein BH708_18960 [Brachybacterium sp. P6-10-X1]|uniref:hypothetical protein n=1 Tax=Brachybacterium sp. P6-10-X1 TaxID=1903186 RepID=UPI000971863A|nr:hypothetical protein [Brachybacterium sp. P6-10-X1]APX34443.1 hypothetical protein BH708_18960 [Brachybacterium sp. P6-10-X1]
MRSKIFVAALVLITAAYCWGLGWIAWGFLRVGSALGYGLALGIAILLALSVWVIWREVLFGVHAGDLSRRYQVPPDAVPGDPRAEFEAARTAVQDSGEADWTAWYRLALAYDALRDRAGARRATRRAIDAARR